MDRDNNNSGYGEFAPPSFPQHAPAFPQEEHLGHPPFPSEHQPQDPFAGAHPQPPFPGAPSHSPSLPQPQTFSDFPSPGTQRTLMDPSVHPPPPSQPNANHPPPSGYRIPLTAEAPFPTADFAKPPPCKDADGSPVFIGSALLDKSVHPCKIAPHLRPSCRVPYGGGEFEHNGRFDLLPFEPHLMEWVQTHGGQIPHGRRPVEGGYEDGGAKLYHALANIHGTLVPGKTGEHLVRRASLAVIAS
jgi:hypothetical protein